MQQASLANPAFKRSGLTKAHAQLFQIAIVLVVAATDAVVLFPVWLIALGPPWTSSWYYHFSAHQTPFLGWLTPVCIFFGL